MRLRHSLVRRLPCNRRCRGGAGDSWSSSGNSIVASASAIPSSPRAWRSLHTHALSFVPSLTLLSSVAYVDAGLCVTLTSASPPRHLCVTLLDSSRVDSHHLRQRVTSAIEAEEREEVAPEDEEPSIHSELVADVTVPDGSVLSAGSSVRKVWRLRFTSGEGGPPRSLSSLPFRESPRLVRADLDTDERIGSRCLGKAAITPSDLRASPGLVASAPGTNKEELLRPRALSFAQPAAESGDAHEQEHEESGLVDVAVELTAPLIPGSYRVFFRLLMGPSEAAPTLGGCNELFCDFAVA